MIERPVILEFDGGDGDQSVFGAPFVARQISDRRANERGHEMVLFQVISGKWTGVKFGVESRLTDDLKSQLDTRSFISVVVLWPDDITDGSPDNMTAIGMAAPKVLDKGALA